MLKCQDPASKDMGQARPTLERRCGNRRLETWQLLRPRRQCRNRTFQVLADTQVPGLLMPPPQQSPHHNQTSDTLIYVQ